MKRFLPTFVALLLLGGLGTWVYLRETKSKVADSREHIWQVEADDVEKFIEEGWEPMMTLPDGRIIMRTT